MYSYRAHDGLREVATTAGVHSVVVDCESGPVRLGLAAALAQTLGGAVLRPEHLAAGPLADSVRVLTARVPSREVA